MVVPNQPADGVGARDADRGIGIADCAGGDGPHQPADLVLPRDTPAYQPDIADHTAVTGRAKQAHGISIATVDGQTTDGMAETVERTGETVAKVVTGDAITKRLPARAGIGRGAGQGVVADAVLIQADRQNEVLARCVNAVDVLQLVPVAQHPGVVRRAGAGVEILIARLGRYALQHGQAVEDVATCVGGHAPCGAEIPAGEDAGLLQLGGCFAC